MSPTISSSQRLPSTRSMGHLNVDSQASCRERLRPSLVANARWSGHEDDRIDHVVEQLVSTNHRRTYQSACFMPLSPLHRQWLRPYRRLTTLMRPSHPVRHLLRKISAASARVYPSRSW